MGGVGGIGVAWGVYGLGRWGICRVDNERKGCSFDGITLYLTLSLG